MIHVDWVLVVWTAIVGLGLGTIFGLVIGKRGDRP